MEDFGFYTDLEKCDEKRNMFAPQCCDVKVLFCLHECGCTLPSRRCEEAVPTALSIGMIRLKAELIRFEMRLY